VESLLEAMRRDGLALSPLPNGNLGVEGQAEVIAKWASEIKGFKHGLLCLLLLEAGVPREWTQGVARLTAMSVPMGTPEERWQLFVDDSWRFMNTWAVTASQLGWTPEDLFGVCRSGPTKRVDLAGLLWLMNGRELAAIDAHGVAIRCATGSIQTYRPARTSVERVLAWDLPVLLDVGARTWTQAATDNGLSEAA
jgi:hypothetical protein